MIKTYETKNFIIKIDRSLCISCGTCTAIAPNTFELDENFAPRVKPDSNDSLKTILEAARSCATSAITVMDKKTGKKL